MTIGHSINQKILHLWQQTFKDEDDVLLPIFYPSLKEDAILFVGLNPSFSPKGYSSFLRGTAFSNLEPLMFYHWRNRERFDLEISFAIDQIERDNYSYFNKFKDIAAYANLEWEHINLFFYRETIQEQFVQRIYPRSRLTDFAQKQLELSKILILEAKPRVIVAANSFASSLFQKQFPDMQFDEKHGYHRVLFEGRAVPTFFSSRLTGLNQTL
ncbi:MAG: hypothetical protein M3430_06295 [Acidobacteriota bacterium]|nr:hypothetical protein [Acidobacteriota bacterium]